MCVTIREREVLRKVEEEEEESNVTAEWGRWGRSMFIHASFQRRLGVYVPARS